MRDPEISVKLHSGVRRAIEVMRAEFFGQPESPAGRRELLEDSRAIGQNGWHWPRLRFVQQRNRGGDDPIENILEYLNGHDGILGIARINGLGVDDEMERDDQVWVFKASHTFSQELLVRYITFRTEEGGHCRHSISSPGVHISDFTRN